MNKPDHDVYAEYFSFRKVGSDFYGDYSIPAYLENVLPTDRNAAILDIGCGFGQTLRALRAEGYVRLCGIDISDEAVSSCTANGLNVTKIESVSSYCRITDKRFDFIIMAHVIEHIEKAGIIETLRAIRTNLLNDGGRLMVITPNAQSSTGCYWAYEDFTHSTIFTAGSLYFVLRCAGFEQVEFIDSLGIAGSHPFVRLMKQFLIPLYKAKIAFWNRVINSSFHRPSPQIYTYELKALAK